MSLSYVNFIFRSKRNGAVSIEQIFENIAIHISKSKKTYLPYEKASFFSLLGNIIASVKSKNKINHVTGDVHYLVPFLYRSGFNILTIHDFAALENSSKYSIKYWMLLYFWYKIPVKFADRITVISEKTAKDLTKYVSVPMNKVQIIPNPVDPLFSFVPSQPFNKENVQLLFIGSTPNKNLITVLKSLKNIRSVLTVIGLISQEAKELISRLNLKVINLYDLSIAELYAEYIKTDMLLFPSTYEGFGMPIIEAQSVGRPIITSNIEPMTWVAGSGGAYFVDPSSEESIQDAIIKLINDNILRQDLIQKGLENVNRFKLENIVNQYIKVYQCAESLAK